MFFDDNGRQTNIVIMTDQTTEISFSVVFYTGIMYTGLVISGWLLIRLTIACFKLPALLNTEQYALNDEEATKKAYKILTGNLNQPITSFY